MVCLRAVDLAESGTDEQPPVSLAHSTTPGLAETKNRRLANARPAPNRQRGCSSRGGRPREPLGSPQKDRSVQSARSQCRSAGTGTRAICCDGSRWQIFDCQPKYRQVPESTGDARSERISHCWTIQAARKMRRGHFCLASRRVCRPLWRDLTARVAIQFSTRQTGSPRHVCQFLPMA